MFSLGSSITLLGRCGELARMLTVGVFEGSQSTEWALVSGRVFWYGCCVDVQDSGEKGETKAIRRPKRFTGQAGIRGTWPLQRQTLIDFQWLLWSCIYTFLSIRGGRSSSVGLDLYFYHGSGLDLLLIGKQKCPGLICLTPRSQQ